MVIDTGINYNLTAGTSVGLQPTYQWNAKVTSGTIQIYDAEGNAVADSYTSEGDHITILSICPSEYTQLSLALIQFPDQSNSCYIQGYIQTSDFNLLECRFNNSWIDTTNNQQIIFANGDLADRTLSTGDYQTYLYATDNYACISFLNDDYAFKSGFVPLNSGNLNIIETDIPFYLAPGSSIGTKLSYPSNATTIASQIEIVDINGITIPNNYTSNGDNITILDVYMNEKLALIEFPDSYAGTYIIGYIPVENLINGNIKLKSNYCNWNSSTKEYSIYDLQKSVIYKIESSQTTQYLFKTDTYACILFNNNNITNWPLETGFVSLTDGSFGLGKSSEKESNNQKNENTGTDQLSLVEIAALYIGSFEGFRSEPYTFGVGPYASSIGYGMHYTPEQFPHLPITKEEAFQSMISYIDYNLKEWNNLINEYLDISTLTDCQLVALYDFTYNEGSYYLPALCQKISQDNTFANTFANWELPTTLASRRYDEWLTYVDNKYHFGNSIYSLPKKYIPIANSLNS